MQIERKKEIGEIQSDGLREVKIYSDTDGGYLQMKHQIDKNEKFQGKAYFYSKSSFIVRKSNWKNDEFLSDIWINRDKHLRIYLIQTYIFDNNLDVHGTKIEFKYE